MNQQAVSKVRTKKTRTRERQAGRGREHRRSIENHPWIGFLIVVVLWAACVAALSVDTFLDERRPAPLLLSIAGDAVFLFLGLIATGIFLRLVRPRILGRNMNILLLATVALLSVLVAKATYYITAGTTLIPAETARFLLPLVMAPLFLTILVDAVVAVAVGSWVALVIGAIADHDFAITVTGLLMCPLTAQLAWRVRGRSKVVRTGLIVGLCQAAGVFGAMALAGEPAAAVTILHRAGACILSGFVASLFVLLILPAFEAAFGITTDISLLELSDLGHPLLQRLAMEAPGTYHHSLVVANLAQAAADAIGANALLARVAAYFHDIGKLTKPSFFAENIQMQQNPHDHLPPSMSTLVITAHVKEGLSLALLHKLPAVVRAVISEHHVTSIMKYFHEKARAQLEEDEQESGGAAPSSAARQLDDTAFRYNGPIPSSRESAIICLADGIEAASRTLEKPTPGHIESLVEDLTRARLEDGQLDNSGLTLSDLAAIKRSFIFTLTNMLHARIPYPKDEDRDKQPPRGPKSQPAGARKAGPAADEKSGSDA